MFLCGQRFEPLLRPPPGLDLRVSLNGPLPIPPYVPNIRIPRRPHAPGEELSTFGQPQFSAREDEASLQKATS
uniref:Uncharacterized protein n=1 Tax=Moniliophthora roreri TaxID=221103 RepID=A0A0W0F240_MONRR